ncbi:Butyrophilin subfamily 3 member A2 [Platysternon megacephalum]|uniref:Butyrophilin subfamily 3 member A2 n=1 Tax=Platysternon megacephalum TaxID=55544 RepID=A0A4D9DTI8_9SAUR|nr:Butyrophilin subfamily 3 member A2 [Platysternon megacephalum]
MLGARRPHSSAALLSAVLLLHVQAAAAVSFQVLAPSGPLSAPLGGTVLLSCHLSPTLSAQAMQVKWSRLGQDVHLYLPDGSEVQGERYRGRTELLRDGIQSGSLVLRIRNLTLQDEGHYLCDFQSDSTVGNATLELCVTSSGSDPLLHIGGYDGKQMNVTCLSVGWYPKPKVLWSNGHKERLTPSNKEKISRNQGLFDVSSSVVVTEHSDPTLICAIIPSSPGPEKVSAILISDDFFPQVSSWKVGLFLFLSVCVCLLFLPACYLWRVQRAKRKSSNLTTKK